MYTEKLSDDNIFSDCRWFCHFDDDQYVNVPRLVGKLGEFPAGEAWYLGKPSIDKPIEIIDRDNFDLQVSTYFEVCAIFF